MTNSWRAVLVAFPMLAGAGAERQGVEFQAERDCTGRTCLSEFRIPREFESEQSFHPVGYLECCPVADVKKTLTPEDRTRLVKLFLAAHDACMRKYHQSYFISTKVPLYQLLAGNEPRVAKLRPQEGGNVVYLGSIAQVLRNESGRPTK
jgi:hypothetical protein